MSPDSIQAIATEIARQTPFNWYYFVILGLLTLVASSAGAFLGSYMKKRGEQRAFTADFNEIKTQLRETTRAQETIRAEVHRMSERSERLEWLKREKLENYVQSVSAMPDYMKSFSERAIFKAGEPGVYDPHPFNTADMLCALYLPELTEVHGEFTRAVSALHDVVADGLEQRQLNDAGQYVVPEKVLKGYDVGLEHLYDVVKVVIRRAADVAAEMNRPDR